jgi:hypothetical protein
MSEFALQAVRSSLLTNNDRSSFDALFSKKLKQANGVRTLFDFLEGSGAISKEAAAMLKVILGLHQASLR